MSVADEKEELKKKLLAEGKEKKMIVVRCGRTANELTLTTRDILPEILKKHKYVYLPDKICKVERCDKFKRDCKKCVSSFWLEEYEWGGGSGGQNKMVE